MQKRFFITKIVTALFLLMLFSTTTFAEGPTKDTDGTYFVNANGTRVLDDWALYNGKWYHTNNQGKILTGFFTDNKTGKIYFLDTNDTANYGSMVANGLHVIDGYSYLFNADGSIMTANGISITDIGNGFAIDSTGKLYHNGQILQDISTNRSEFYSNEANAKNLAFNNYLLFTNNNLTPNVVGPGGFGPGVGTTGNVIGGGAASSGGGGGGGGGGGRKWTDPFTAEERTIVNEFKENYIKDGMSEFEIEMQIIQWMIENITYDFDNYLNSTIPSQSYESYGAIVNKKAVCDGYSKAFLKIAQDCGLTVARVSGQANGYGGWEGHSWNQIYLDGEWYNVDVTWEDPVPTNDYKFGDLRNDYINVPDAIFNVDHKGNGKNTCTATKYGDFAVTAYLKLGKVITDKDTYRDTITKSFKEEKVTGSIVAVPNWFNRNLKNILYSYGGYKYDDNRNHLLNTSDLEKTKVLNYIKKCLDENYEAVVITSTNSVDLNEYLDYIKHNINISDYKAFINFTDDHYCIISKSTITPSASDVSAPSDTQIKFYNPTKDTNKADLKTYLQNQINDFNSQTSTSKSYAGIVVNNGADMDFFTEEWISSNTNHTLKNIDMNIWQNGYGLISYRISLTKWSNSDTVYTDNNIDEIKTYLIDRFSSTSATADRRASFFVNKHIDMSFFTNDWIRANVNNGYNYEIYTHNYNSATNEIHILRIGASTVVIRNDADINTLKTHLINTFATTTRAYFYISTSMNLDFLTDEWAKTNVNNSYNYTFTTSTGYANSNYKYITARRQNMTSAMFGIASDSEIKLSIIATNSELDEIIEGDINTATNSDIFSNDNIENEDVILIATTSEMVNEDIEEIATESEVSNEELVETTTISKLEEEILETTIALETEESSYETFVALEPEEDIEEAINISEPEEDLAKSLSTSDTEDENIDEFKDTLDTESVETTEDTLINSNNVENDEIIMMDTDLETITN